MEVYVLFDEELGECQVFLEFEDATDYFEKKATGKWKPMDGDDSVWMSTKGYFYIFKREII